jgi:superfamily II DNA or RNA helicase
MNHELDSLLGEAEALLEKQETELSSIEKPVEKEVRERIARIQLCQKMIRNIRMNMLTASGGGLQLRFNQLNAIAGLIKFLQDEGGKNFKGRFKQPTGAGKTVLFGFITKLINVKTLVLVPKQNLLQATKDEFVTMVGMDEATIGLVGGGSYELGNQVTVATYQSHILKMENDPEYRQHVQECELVICDEAHRALGKRTKDSIDALDKTEDEESNTEEQTEADGIVLTEEEAAAEEKVLKDLDTATNRQSAKLAFTATPTLSNKDVADDFPYLIAEEKQSDLVQAKILVGYVIIQVGAEQRTDDFEGYLTEEEEANILEREGVYEKLTKEYAEVLRNYREKEADADYKFNGVAFCVNIAECDKYAKEAEKNGLRARVVTGREAKGKKGNAFIKQAEQDLLNGVIDQIVTVNKLGEGWNFPPANAAVWARASTSPMIVIQGIGRTGRAYIDPQGREKPFSYVFETKWSLRNDSGRYVKRPLTIAQALLENGEDPSLICQMENKSELKLDRITRLDPETGIATIDGVDYVEADRYCKHRLGTTQGTTRHFLKQWNAKPVETSQPVVLRGKIMTCYRKSDIDQHIDQMTFISTETGMGIANLPNGQTIEVVYPQKYLVGKTSKIDRWLNCAHKDGLNSVRGKGNLPIPAYIRPDATARICEVEVYDKKLVDEMLENLLFIGNQQDVELKVLAADAGKGIEIQEGEQETETRTAVALNNYEGIPKGLLPAVTKKLEELGLGPIKKMIYGRGGRPLTMHWKDDVDRAITEVVAEVAEKKRIEDEKVAKEIQRKRDEVIRALQEKKKQVDANTESAVTPQEQPGVFYIKYKLPVNQGKKIIEGEGLAVNLDTYIPESLGRKLTAAEKQIVLQKLPSIPKMMYYWKKDVDERIARL